MGYPPSGSKDWSTNEILTESDLEGEFTHTRSLLIPENIDDFSANATEYGYTTTPSSSSLPTVLSEEIRHFRGAVKRGFNLTNWYDAPSIYPNYQIAPPVSMVWKDAATITIQKGDYLIGGQVYNQAANADITFAGAGAPDYGLDTGAEASSTWYYVYSVDYQAGGTLGYAISATAPTARFDTDLSGTDYDTNTYLGAIYNDSGDDIEEFVHVGNKFMYYMYNTGVSHTGDTNVTSKTIQIPESASAYHGYINCVGPSTLSGIYSTSSASSTYYIVVQSGYTGFELPVTTAQTTYISTNNSGGTVNAYIKGWTDKYL